MRQGLRLSVHGHLMAHKPTVIVHWKLCSSGNAGDLEKKTAARRFLPTPSSFGFRFTKVNGNYSSGPVNS
jgi:hypothetical protein